MLHGTKSLGQYFTPKHIADFMCELISKDKSATILDPSAGKGVFLNSLCDHGFKNLKAYEIDESIPNESCIHIDYRDFLSVSVDEKYDVIVGNPPYVRWKNIPEQWRKIFRHDEYWSRIMNGLGDLTYTFIYHAVNLLKKGGELIFICPLFWTETFHGKHLREHLSNNGSLELLINLNEARVFKEVSSTTLIFKYVKGVKLPYTKVVEYRSKRPVISEVMKDISQLITRLGIKESAADVCIEEGNFRAYLFKQFSGSKPWHPIPPNEKMVREIDMIQNVFHLQGKIAEIGNGMVSGLDTAFRISEEDLNYLNIKERGSLIYVYKANTLERYFPIGRPTPYIFVNHVRTEDELLEYYPHIFHRLSPYKERLEKRYSYYRDIPWWHWVFLRNKSLFEAYNQKIFVPSKDRYDSRGYFRFALICSENDRVYYATQDVTAICVKREAREGIEYILGLLNSQPIQKWIMIKGFSRGGVHDFSEEPIKDIPIPKVDWNDSRQKELHRLIVDVVKETVARRELGKISEIDSYVEELLRLKKKSETLPLTTFAK
jgi:adenine-specific DNA-methyltransferase